MKVSLNWAQDYSNVDIKAAGTDEIVRRIGAQLGAVEEVIDFGSKYKDIVVVKVLSCIKHPNADKLSVCRVDDGGAVQNVERGDDGLVQVVCGAPNVREGQIVAWIPPGATVPSTVEKDPFVIEAREIRDEVSNGMLASASELGISDDHEGILEISADEELAKPGAAFKNLYGLDDVIIDCENKMFTHRPDCFGILGVARELAGIQDLKFQSPNWYTKSTKYEVSSTESLPLEVKVEDLELVPRFMAVAMSSVKVGPSPVWVQAGLKRIGVKPINNIVDLTNYYAHLTGQPMHAYDYDKIAALSGGTPTLVARTAKKGDSAKLLNGKTVEFEAPAVVIATDKQVVGLGGVMGGSDTEVDENTKNIILECATFDMYNIRRTTMKYGLFTDASTRYTKGQSVYQNDRALYKIMIDIVEQYGGKVASDVFDVRSDLPNMADVKVTTGFINERLGSDLKADKIKQLLENVEFIVDIAGDELTVNYPFWRTDIEIPEDIVEEVGRLHGFDKLPVVLPRKQIEPATLNDGFSLKSKLRRTLSSAGANELLTYSFVHGNLMDKIGQDKAKAFELSNALSPDLQFYRLTLTPSLLDKVHANIKAGHNQFAIFEIGKAHMQGELGDDGLPAEQSRLAFVFAADEKTAKANYQGAAYYQAQRYLHYLLDSFGISCGYQKLEGSKAESENEEQTIAPFNENRSAYVVDKNGVRLGVIGEFSPSVRRSLKLPDFSAGFELDIDKLAVVAGNNTYMPLNKFPSTSQDVTLKVKSELSYKLISEGIRKVLNISENQHGYRIALSPTDIYQSDTNYKNLTFRLDIDHPDRTLVTEEVSNLVSTIADELKAKQDAVRI